MRGLPGAVEILAVADRTCGSALVPDPRSVKSTVGVSVTWRLPPLSEPMFAQSRTAPRIRCAGVLGVKTIAGP
ncbi:hypothetical protein [Thermomonospora umbrina]|uniref:hypothetical protein n=1 Tax=Thermomonospora umbrina TaxID=111806 RepID=UPI0011C1768E|nr:hypothetical protein [Thermomonospora umbrina]